MSKQFYKKLYPLFLCFLLAQWSLVVLWRGIGPQSTYQNGKCEKGIENGESLSKTTKLILLDSLLQEVCISSVFDGSLTLSSLGLSVCLSQSQTPFFRTKESPLTSLILTICGLQLVRNTLSAITNPLFWNLLWIWNINTFQSFFYALVCYICANLPYLNILCVVIGKKYIIFLW